MAEIQRKGAFQSIILCISNPFQSIIRVPIESLGSFRLETQKYNSKS